MNPHTSTTTTLPAMEQSIVELTARSVADPDNAEHRHALTTALARLDKAREDIAERKAFDDARAAEMNEADERRLARERDQRKAANAALAEADKAYREAAVACALAFRAVLDQVEKNNHIPGAAVEHTLGPDIPHLNLHGFRGVPFSTAQQMGLGKTIWENTRDARIKAGLEPTP